MESYHASNKYNVNERFKSKSHCHIHEDFKNIIMILLKIYQKYIRRLAEFTLTNDKEEDSPVFYKIYKTYELEWFEYSMRIDLIYYNEHNQLI